MDAYLIARLEALMGRSPVSPYAVARFLFVGCGLFFVVAKAPDFLHERYTTVNVLLTVWAAAGISTSYRQTDKAEKENDRGYCNHLKAQKMPRILSLFVMSLNLPIFFLPPMTKDGVCWIVTLMLFIAALYLQAINWTPPPPKRRVPSFAVGDAA